MDARWGAIDCRPEDGVYFACRLLQKFYVIDMRYAIMSDVHANPQALEGALADARRLGCTRFLMLGDIVGYGYEPKRALELVRDNFDVVLMGNHDSVCLGLENEFDVQTNPNYRSDVAARTILDAADKEWIETRRKVHVESGAAFVHGDFTSPFDWNYILQGEAAVANFDCRKERLLFCGHTHELAQWERQPDGTVVRSMTFPKAVCHASAQAFVPARDARYIVNVGSVGYPRYEFSTTYVIWDCDTNRIVYRMLPFDFKSYVEEMINHNQKLPGWLMAVLNYTGAAPLDPCGTI